MTIEQQIPSAAALARAAVSALVELFPGIEDVPMMDDGGEDLGWATANVLEDDLPPMGQPLTVVLVRHVHEDTEDEQILAGVGPCEELRLMPGGMYLEFKLFALGGGFYVFKYNEPAGPLWLETGQAVSTIVIPEGRSLTDFPGSVTEVTTNVKSYQIESEFEETHLDHPNEKEFAYH